MKNILFATSGALLLAAVPAICNAQVDTRWKIHDPGRPVPPVIDSGTPSTQDSPGRPPSDAVVLFDGKDLSKWAHKDGSAAKWKQWRLLARALRDASPRLLPKQDLRRRPGRSDLRPIPSAGERFAPARPMADLRHRLSRAAL